MTTLADPIRQLDGADVLQAMATELRLLADLREALAEQRAGVASDDPEGIDTATHRVARSIFTLDEARRRREWVTKLATGGEGDLRTLETALGPVDGFTDAHRALRQAAASAASDIALNQGILRRALRRGESYLQALFASVGEDTGSATANGLLMNRSA